MITVRCKCKKTIMKFNNLKEGDIVEFESGCCKELAQQEPATILPESSEKINIYDRKFDHEQEHSAKLELSEATKSLMAEQAAVLAKSESDKSKKKFTYFEPKEAKK